MKQIGDWIRIIGATTEETIEESKKIAREVAEKALEKLGALDYTDSIKVWVNEDPDDPIGYPLVFWKVALPDSFATCEENTKEEK